MEIHVVDNNVEKAIRVLKRKLQQEGMFREMKQRKYYEKPSVVCARRCGLCIRIKKEVLKALHSRVFK